MWETGPFAGRRRFGQLIEKNSRPAGLEPPTSGFVDQSKNLYLNDYKRGIENIKAGCDLLELAGIRWVWVPHGDTFGYNPNRFLCLARVFRTSLA